MKGIEEQPSFPSVHLGEITTEHDLARINEAFFPNAQTSSYVNLILLMLYFGNLGLQCKSTVRPTRG
jgi:hypothetical protein